MKDFNLKKFLLENQLTQDKKYKVNIQSRYYESEDNPHNFYITQETYDELLADLKDQENKTNSSLSGRDGVFHVEYDLYNDPQKGLLVVTRVHTKKIPPYKTYMLTSYYRPGYKGMKVQEAGELSNWYMIDGQLKRVNWGSKSQAEEVMPDAYKTEPNEFYAEAYQTIQDLNIPLEQKITS